MIAASLKSKFFLQNLRVLLLPLTIPLIILGGFSILVSESYLKDFIDKGNNNLLAQTQQNLDSLTSSLTTTTLLLETDNGVGSFFDTYFGSENLDYSGLRTQNLISGFLSSIALAKPGIQSIYVYYPNRTGYFYVTHEGRVTVEGFRDNSWFASYLAHPKNGENWTEVRQVPQFRDRTNPVTTVSLFQTLPSSGGVVVLNLDAHALPALWNGLSVLPGQEILVLSREGDLLFGNVETPVRDRAELRRLALGAALGRLPGTIVSRVTEEHYGWVIVSLTPETTLYNLPAYLSSLTVLLLVLSFAAGFALTAHFVRMNYAQVQTIRTVIEAAEQGKPLPPLPQKIGTIYEQITFDVLQAFLEQSYLKLQLSEKTSRTRLLELEAHQNQMNPHFLFNTLKTIYWRAFALSGSPNDACVMIDNLSDILDYALRPPEEKVPLAEEIRTCQSYLAIQEVRYAGLFQTTWSCPEALRGVLVPKLLLQPLLENCISHGIREKGVRASIRVTIRAREGRLSLLVSDDGVGMDAATLKALRGHLSDPEPPSSHIGLSNTHKRIRLSYGDQWGLDVRSRPGRGTCVRIQLPL